MIVGRISRKINLQPLTLAESAQFWSDRETSSREILTALCVTGGIPRYLEQIDCRESAEWNIQRLCFEPSGYLASELPNLIKSSFLSATRGPSLERYLKILTALCGTGKTPAEIEAATGIHNNESLGDSLAALTLSGLVSENPSWSIKTTEVHQRNVRYRVEDPYTRFYLRYIQPRLKEIAKGLYRSITLQQLPSWEVVRGLQFEVLVGQNISPVILDRLNLRGMPVQRFGPYFQNKTAQHRSVQIDYLLQTDGTLYVCETKFSKLIDASVIDEVKEKTRRLGAPRAMTIRKVLIYSGELDRALKDSIYFDREICADELLR